MRGVMCNKYLFHLCDSVQENNHNIFRIIFAISNQSFQSLTNTGSKFVLEKPLSLPASSTSYFCCSKTNKVYPDVLSAFVIKKQFILGIKIRISMQDDSEYDSQFVLKRITDRFG